jgi:hypothetical protein
MIAAHFLSDQIGTGGNIYAFLLAAERNVNDISVFFDFTKQLCQIHIQQVTIRLMPASFNSLKIIFAASFAATTLHRR